MAKFDILDWKPAQNIQNGAKYSFAPDIIIWYVIWKEMLFR